MRKSHQFNAEVVFPRVAHYIRASGTSYTTHGDLVELLERDLIINSHVQEMRRGGYKHGIEVIASKMVGFFSWCWTLGIGPGMKDYQSEFERSRIDRRYAYRVKG